MRKFLIVTLSVMVSLVTSWSNASGGSQPLDLSESVFKVKSCNMRNRCIQGTAFALDVLPNGALVTAAHAFGSGTVTCEIITADSLFPCEVAVLDRTRSEPL